MQFKHTSSGLTLLEIMFSLIIASLILLYLIPQQLKTSRDQMVSQTVAEMNQIVLAARNYYLDQRTANPSNNPETLWPLSLSVLTSNNYLPAAALCSSWPSASVDTTGNNCNYQKPYLIFPSNTSNQYDKTLNGIKVNSPSPNKGGSFWGVSITLPNATVAQAVEQRLPFATLCDPAQLKNGLSTSCTATSNTVTAIVPRPAQWPVQTINYSEDGLIQMLNTSKQCTDSGSSNARNPSTEVNLSTGAITKMGTDKPCNSPSYDYPKAAGTFIPINSTDSDSCDANSTPVVFYYPARMYPFKAGDPVVNNNTLVGYGQYFPGISSRMIRNEDRLWIYHRIATDTQSTSTGSRKFHDIFFSYFITCAPNNGIAGTDPYKWDPSNFPGTSANGPAWPTPPF